MTADVIEGTGTLQSKGAGQAVIQGEMYVVADFVQKFLDRVKVGSEVDYQFELSNDGTKRRLVRIQQHKTTDKKPEVKTGAEIKQIEDTRRRITLTGYSTALISFQFEDGQKNKSSVALSTEQYDQLEEWGIRSKLPLPGCEISWNTAGMMKGVWIPGINAPDPLPRSGKEILKENLDQVREAPPKEPAPVTTTRDTSTSPRMWSGETNLTIGVTINLDNYENLRVSVSGSAADRSQLIEYLNETLDCFGKTEATRGMIDAYRKRVIG